MKLAFALVCVLAVATSASAASSSSSSSAVFAINNDLVYAQEEIQENDGDEGTTTTTTITAIDDDPGKPLESKDASDTAAATFVQSSSSSSSSMSDVEIKDDANVNEDENKEKETQDRSKDMPSTTTTTEKTSVLNCNENELTTGNGDSLELCNSLQPETIKEEQIEGQQPTNGVFNLTKDKGIKSTNTGDNKTGAGPDRDCLFNPSLPKCAAIDGKCPDGFFMNEDERCVPEGGCPDGYHRVEDDETGTCYPNTKGCPEGMIFTPDRKNCEYKEYACKKYSQLKECKAEDKGPSSIKIKTDQKIYKLGQTVKTTVTNNGNTAVKFPDSALGLTIKSHSTGEVYRLPAAQAITELKPGDSKTVEWKQQDNGGNQVKPGAYSAMVSAGSLQAKTGFSIAEGPKGPNAGKFIVNVQVTNNGPNDEKGGVYVSIDDTDISKSLHGVTFPSKKTITKTFEFNSKDVPVGKEFSAEVVYGDDYDERARGVNSPANTPETVRIYIGPYSDDDRLKFKLNVQVTNNKATDERGQIFAHIDGTNLYKSLDNVVFPSKKTITKTFEFNSKDVPVGKGYTVNVEPVNGPTETVRGVNSPANMPETAKVTIR